MLEFTGERFIPGEGDPLIYYEHAHRYLFATQLADGRRVLDIASGEGYGTSWLAAVARHVVGVDNSEETVRHATQTYGRSNLAFVVGDAVALPLETDSVDLVVSFETIEHLDDVDAFLSEIVRVLSPDGIVIISTPNKKTYTDDTGYDNVFHTTEFYIDEFERMLSARFAQCAMLGQKVLGTSAMWALSGIEGERRRGVFGEPGAKEGDGPPSDISIRDALEPLYAVAICSPKAIDAQLGGSLPSLFIEQAESLMKEYQGRWEELGRPDPEHTARVEAEAQALRETLAAREAEIARRDDIIDSANAEVASLRARLAQAEAAARVANQELEAVRATRTWRLHGRLERILEALPHRSSATRGR